MSMEINGINHIYNRSYVDKPEQEQKQAQNITPPKAEIPEPKDEYISSEKSDTTPIGLYRLGQDKDGNPKVFYDDPEMAKGSDKEKAPKIDSANPKDKAEQCTTNTDKVDREIEKLKEKKAQLEQQLRGASGDDKKTEEISKKIAALENELRQKDNDTYRRQHAVIS